MKTFDEELREQILSLDLGYTYKMSDYATSKEQEADYEAEGLAEVSETITAIKTLIKQHLPEPKEELEDSPLVAFTDGKRAKDQVAAGFNACLKAVEDRLGLE